MRGVWHKKRGRELAQAADRVEWMKTIRAGILNHAKRMEDPEYRVRTAAKQATARRSKSRKPTLPHVKFLDKEHSE